MKFIIKSTVLLLLLLFPFYSLLSQETPSQDGGQQPTTGNTDAEQNKESLKINSDSPILVQIVNSKKDTFKESSLSVSFGYNFDFLDGIRTNDLYADFKAEYPHVFGLEKSKTGFLNKVAYGIGLEAGITQFRTISVLDTLDTIFETFRMVDGELNNNDSLELSYITVQSKSIKKTKRENLGIFVQPNFQLFHSSTSKKDTRLSLVIHAEWLRSIIIKSINREVIERKTSSSVPDDWPRPYNTVNSIPGDEINKSTLYNTYLGGGLNLKLKRDQGNFQLKTVFGYNHIKLVEGIPMQSGSRLTFDDGWFYLIQMQILESKDTGIKLGAEVRGVFTNSKPQITLDRTVPTINIYLAKQFSFKKIGEFLQGS